MGINVGDLCTRLSSYRIRTMVRTLRIMHYKNMNKEQLLKEVRNRTDIGRAYAKSQILFMKWLVKEVIKKDGK